ncbi:group 1 glycosyl transferase [hydrothermal vent metagenome]|uniref:Group 1 glycosyl transferase n=1 Tax=hydrothermal vent metagenome TaxID=652676 RepID=A0A3B1BKY2_9ZZZZ
MIKTLLFSSLFPNNAQPQHGIFVENRLRHLLETEEIETKVLAPVPWFPFKAAMFGKYAKFACVPQQEQRNAIDIMHPRYFLLPKIGMNTAPEAIYRTALPHAQRLIESGFNFDLIDAHYFYPDGVAAVMLAKKLGKPVIITARGSDLNLIPQYTIPRKKILWATRNADALVTVCQALKDVLLGMGGAEEKVTVLRNGVDLKKFIPPEDRAALRKDFGLGGKTLLSVGNLVELKGHHLIIEALNELPDFELIIVGNGEEHENLERQIESSGYKNRIKMIGVVEHSKLKDYYGAADALVLASSREGWANVLLEAMACGCPVLATNAGGSSEIVAEHAAGVLVQSRSVEGIVQGLKKLFTKLPERQSTRKYAEKFGWQETTKGQVKLFERVLSNA